MHLYRHQTFVWKNVENFKRLLLWSLLANVVQILCGASLGWGNKRLLKRSQSIDQDGCHAIYGKKSSPEPNKPWCLNFAQILGDRRFTKIAKMMVPRWHLTFLRQGQICFSCICMGPIHIYGKNVENSYFGHLLYNPIESKLDDEH